MKKYLLPRLFQIPRIYYIIMSFFFTSYHCSIVTWKNISYPGFSKYLAFTILLHHSFSFVSSYHEKIYLTQRFQIPCIYYISTSLFSLCIIVSWKNISYPGFSKYRAFTIITSFFFTSYHRFMKKYILPRLFQIPRIYYIITSFFFTSYHHRIMKKDIYYIITSFFFTLYHHIMKKYILPRIFQLPRIYYINTSFFFASYHRIMKNILPRLFELPLIYYIIISFFFTLYHRIIVSWKNIAYPGFFKYRAAYLLYYYVILSHFVSSYHQKIYLTQAFPNTSNLLYYYVVLFHFVSSSYHEKRHLLYYYVILFHFVSSYHEKIYLTQDFSTTAHLLY